LYGSHPYGRPTEGDERSLTAITREDIVSFYQKYYTPGNTILMAVGDFNTTDMERLLTGKFRAWPRKPATVLNLPEAHPLEGKRVVLVDKPDSPQTFFQVGNVGITRTNPDRVYIDVVNMIFGGRFDSMLNTELRVNSGLTYGAYSLFERRKAWGPFLISTYTQTATTEKAIDLALDVLRRLQEKGITEEDLKSTKSFIKGQFPLSIETSDQLASVLEVPPRMSEL
jgi:predicted Zn-dependent peptidase